MHAHPANDGPSDPPPATRTAPAVPPIGPPTGGDRPFWSVMIPSFEADPAMLEQSLGSVLAQDPGPDRMQVAVVEDASPAADRTERLVRRLAGDRVEFHRNAANLGLAGNWNRCVELARGRWVHLLHQDDLVLPGFYEALGRADRERPDAGAAFCQHLWVDAEGHWTQLSPLERDRAGVIDGWLDLIASEQRVQCASIVVRRDVYERLGGYRSDLRMALDWEMWVRIAARYPVWFEPTVLAHYRFYDGSQTTRLRREDAVISDIERAIGLVRQGLPAPHRGIVGAGLRPILRDELLGRAASLMLDGDYRAGLAAMRRAGRYESAWNFWPTRLAYLRWALKLAAEHWLGRRPGGRTRVGEASR